MKKVFLIGILFLLFGCNQMLKINNGIDVTVVNQTNNVLKGVTFHTSEKIGVLVFNDIKPGDSSKVFFRMKEHQIDGHYILNVTKNDSVSKVIEEGYYSNGFSSNEWVRFEIKNDTVITNFKF